MAPEVLGHEAYSSQVDLWSIGVIVYILLCGFPPFYGDNDAQMFKRIKAGQYKFLAPYWDQISAEAKDFVRNLLIVDPKKRMTAAEALNHRWLGRTANVSTKNLFAAADAQSSKGKPAGDKHSSATEPEGMQAQLMQYNCDRKVALPDNLKRLFRAHAALELSETALGFPKLCELLQSEHIADNLRGRARIWQVVLKLRTWALFIGSIWSVSVRRISAISLHHSVS